ncbi:MAG: L-threonylcarbamoyladenylate synthase, partial [Candidatus Bathyarchaeia archaeon]|nr:L-threonylcarbamoyladenylate synthase [Candidatus Bathyarchaeia archaeon]
MMKRTIMLKVNPKKPEIEKVQAAAKIIQQGGLVAFPTETVYGLGAEALNPKAVLALFEAKKRPLDNPPIVHVENIGDIYRLAKQVTPKADKLMRTFWPGPLTLVFKHSIERFLCSYRLPTNSPINFFVSWRDKGIIT